MPVLREPVTRMYTCKDCGAKFPHKWNGRGAKSFCDNCLREHARKASRRSHAGDYAVPYDKHACVVRKCRSCGRTFSQTLHPNSCNRSSENFTLSSYCTNCLPKMRLMARMVGSRYASLSGHGDAFLCGLYSRGIR